MYMFSVCVCVCAFHIHDLPVWVVRQLIFSEQLGGAGCGGINIDDHYQHRDPHAHSSDAEEL